jgi:hypothetical protein
LARRRRQPQKRAEQAPGPATGTAPTRVGSYW